MHISFVRNYQWKVREKVSYEGSSLNSLPNIAKQLETQNDA